MDTNRITTPEAEEILGLYFPVLDYGFVSLADYMGGDESIEQSARVSYGAGTRKKSDTRNLIRYLFRHRHTSPFEMAELRFHIGLPIFVMRQLIRHRTANVNEYSGRYSIMPLMFYTPEREQVAFQAQTNKQGRFGVVDERTYEDFACQLKTVRNHSSNFYTSNVNLGIARELSRIDLPLSTYTYCYWKMDLRNLFHLIGLRSDPHAQWEIRAFSDVMAGIVKRVAPLSFEAFLDYQMGGVTFRQAEMDALRIWFTLSVNTSHNARRNFTIEALKENGITGREVDEFFKKLEPKEKRSFDLDLSTAKPAYHFEELMARHAVETPQ